MGSIKDMHEKWRYEVKCLLNTPALRLRPDAVDIRGDFDHIYIKFEQDYFAPLFGLCVSKNSFPTASTITAADKGAERKGKMPSSLSYGIKYWSGSYSLHEHREMLAGRNTIMLIPQYYHDHFFSLGQYSQSQSAEEDNKLSAYMKNAAITAARADGKELSELIICCTGGEELYGILAGFTLRERGYIIFPEYDFGMIDACLGIGRMGGVPDMVAAKLGEFQDRLIDQGAIEYGAWFHELELRQLLLARENGGNGSGGEKGNRAASAEAKKSRVTTTAVPEEISMVIEVEDTSREASGGYRQLLGYTTTSMYAEGRAFFDGGMLVCPKRQSDVERVTAAVTATTASNDPDAERGSNNNHLYKPCFEDKDFLVMTWDYKGIMVQPKLKSSVSYSTADGKAELLHICKRLILANMKKNYVDASMPGMQV